MRWLTLLLILGGLFGCSKLASTEGTFDGVSGEIAGYPASTARLPPSPSADAAVDADARAVQPSQRRVVFNATLELLVEDFELSRQKLTGLVESFKGFVSGSEIGGRPGVPRSGRWTVRVPVKEFAAFVDAATLLGEALRSHTDAQDVTEQFVDLEARLTNKRKEEERLLEHLKTSTGKLEDILAVERELTRVRGEIEQTQGRLNRLTDLTDLSTVTISLTERRGFQPAQSPSFGTAVGRTFESSLDALATFGKGIVLFVVALAPWLPVVALLFAVVWIAARRLRVPIVKAVDGPSAEH